MIQLRFEYQDLWIVISMLCVLCMASGRQTSFDDGCARNQPFSPNKPLKNKALALLLYALIRAYKRLRALVWAHLRLFALVSSY